MASLTIPVTVDQIRELTRQLSQGERQALIDSLLAERYDATMSSGPSTLTDAEIQVEVDAVRDMRQETRRRATGR